MKCVHGYNDLLSETFPMSVCAAEKDLKQLTDGITQQPTENL